MTNYDGELVFTLNAKAYTPGAKSLPRLCIVGPMVGRTPGYVTTQGERLSDLLAAEGFPVVSVSSRLNRYARMLDILRTIISRHRRTDAMVLQVFGGSSFVVEDAASLLARRFGIPIIMVLRGGAMPDFMGKHPTWSRRVLDRAASIVVPSAYLAEAIDKYGYEAKVIANIINIAQYRFRCRNRLQPRILWMRAFHPIYNPQMALNAFARVKQTQPNASMVMAGEEKGLGQECQALAESLGVSNSVRFAGFLNMEAKAREGDAADIYLNTNRIDNMPVSVIEAAAMGMPVVATAVGGVPYLLRNEETGLLVPDNDADSAAAAICRLLDEPDLAERLSVNGRALAEQSSWERIRPLWLELIDHVTSARTARTEREGLCAE